MRRIAGLVLALLGVLAGIVSFSGHSTGQAVKNSTESQASPIMTVLVMTWFLLLGLVVFLNKPIEKIGK